MKRESDFERLLFLHKMEGKGINLEQYSFNNGAIVPLTDGTASGKNETDLHKYLNSNDGVMRLSYLLRRTEEVSHL